MLKSPVTKGLIVDAFIADDLIDKLRVTKVILVFSFSLQSFQVLLLVQTVQQHSPDDPPKIL